MSAAAQVVGVLPAFGDGAGRIGISMPSKSRRWSDDATVMTAAFRAAGHVPDVEFASDDLPTQISQIEDMISSGVKALVIAPVDGTMLSQTLANATALNIPVVAYDHPIRQTRNVDYYSSFDDFQVGVEQAKSLVSGLDQRFPGRKKWNVEIFAGAPGDSAAREYFNGAISVLTPLIASGRIAVPSGQTSFRSCATTGWDSAVAQVRMDNILASFYGNQRIDGALSPDDALAGGIISSLTGVGYGVAPLKMPLVTGMGCGIAAVKEIIAGTLYSSVFKDTRLLARATAQMVDRLLAGGAAETGGKRYDNGARSVPALLVKPELVDAANWKKLLVATRYYRLGQLT